ncbi:hypothetical protein C5167_013909 [Papaver somniferum]|uniref:RING-type domain-containing protein n=1 Tax=Papaver somniferum TaxID=3469 RepID=A0A4Y7J5M3_PAPSO|nr:RING-H2 finger protein ATL8-like [Papaver somniferum]RZC55048.1 hypothetical protein C5167_013909 [Papaver somniferum]
MTSPSTSAVAEPPSPIILDSDFIVILAALLCALICVIGLVAVARCAWLRRTNGDSDNNPSAASLQSQANKGLKRKILKSLPKITYDKTLSMEDCAICLSEFEIGDEIRVLPQCNHGFHVTCIDTWLGSHSSCPSCRQILVILRCKNCGGFPNTSSSSSSSVNHHPPPPPPPPQVLLQLTEAELKAREDHINRFLP